LKGKEMSNEDKGTEKMDAAPVEVDPANPFPALSGLDEKQEFKLPVGSFDLSNSYYRKVNLGALTGKVRKKIGRPDILNHPGKLITALLFELIEFPHFKFTDEPREKKVLIRSMFSADRSACVLAIRKATKKNVAIIQLLKCPACPSRLEVHTFPEEIETFQLEDTKYKVVEGESDVLLTVEAGLPEEDKYTGIFTLSRGFDEERMTTEQMQNVGEYTYAILSGCNRSLNGQKVDEDFFTDRLPISISDALMEEFIANQPGPDTFKEVECNECGTSIQYGVDPSDFLLPNVRQRRLRKRGKK
jgi:hypothetical protein